MADRGTAMTSRGRMLATLRREEVDRFPVWLKMANPTWSSSQPEPYRSMGGTALLQACGCDIIRGCGFPVQALRPRVEESIEIQADRRVHRIRTPDGELVGIEGLDPVTRSAHPLVYPVTTAEQLGRLRWLYTDTSYRADPARVEAARRQQQVAVDADSITMCGIGPGPLMHLVQHLCGPAAAVYLMTDEPALFGEVVALMHADRLRELAARIDGLAADTFWLTENTSTSLISPSLFRTWCVPHLTAYGSMVRGKGIIPVHHMCGMLNALLEDIDALPAMANEAYTTPPVGNTTLAEGRRRMPSKALIGGTNASLWLQPVETILGAVAGDLAACPDRRGIFLTSAGVLPPRVHFEKASRVVAGFREFSP